MAGDREAAILLPGIVMPAALAYGDLLDELGDGVQAIAKELEVYASDQPPHDYELATEVAGVLRLADESGFERFHLVGYSGGGAISLLLAATEPERLLSLTLSEPSWAGWTLEPEEEDLWRRYRELRDGNHSLEEFMGTFVAMQLRDGVEPPTPPPGPPPDWMVKRPAGIEAITRAFERTDIDHDALGRVQGPVLFALGELSNPVQWESMAERLGDAFESFTLERWPGLHHFAPPHRMEPARYAESLRSLWARARPAG